MAQQETPVQSLGQKGSNPLQYSCLGNPMDRGAWWATVHRVAKESNTTFSDNNKNKYSLQFEKSRNKDLFFRILMKIDQNHI